MAGVLDEAIVLRRLDYSETSQVLLLFTRMHGAIRVIAKGAKRSTKTRFVPGIDLLERGQVVFIRSGRGENRLGTLAEWRQSEAHLGLRLNLARWYAGQYAAEITAMMLEDEDPHGELFEALCEFLSSANTADAVAPLVARFQSVLLKTVGLWPELQRCVLCGRAGAAGKSAQFAVAQGGLVCSACSPRAGEVRKVDAATLNALNTAVFDESQSKRAVVLLDEAIRHAVGRPTLLTKWAAARR